MRYVFDVDGVLCSLRKKDQSYAGVTPSWDMIDLVNKLKSEGHTIILYTARGMDSCKGNTGKAIANCAQLLISWLEAHNISYDELHFGKPSGDVYIDDLSITPEDFLEKERKA
jgi:capsule biosynthesis phosphatase